MMMMSVTMGRSNSRSEKRNEEVRGCRMGRIRISGARRVNCIWVTVVVLISLSQEGVECLSPPVSGVMPRGSWRPLARRRLYARRSQSAHRCECYREKSVLESKKRSEEDENAEEDDGIIRIGGSAERCKGIPEGRPASKSTPTLSRRKALLTASALMAAAASSPAVSSASTPAPTLEDVKLGVGRWTDPTEQSALGTGGFTVPALFATYATRVMIEYDYGVGGWWRGRMDEYSLLSADEGSGRLGDDFAAMARSVKMAVEGYVNGGTEGSVQERFVQLANVFIDSYSSRKDSDKDSPANEEFLRHVALLFTMLPKDQQPTQLLKQLAAMSPPPPSSQSSQSSTNSSTNAVNTADSLTKLLPPQYHSSFDIAANAYAITPALPNTAPPPTLQPNTTPTIFGPLSSTPLKRQRPTIPPSIYALFGLSGAFGCALTHSLVIPFDVVKTRLQTDPTRYPNVVDGALSIAKTEGLQAFSLGAQATIAGYVWYGATVYPCYAFFKRLVETSLYTEATAMVHINDIALIAGALAAVVASIGLTPMEACRIRTVAEPNKYRDIGLLGTMAVIANENPSLGWRELYAGFPSLLARQVSFGCVKFLAFERACDAIYRAFPDLSSQSNNAFTALGVTLAAGALSGALSSVVSQPADSVLTYVAKNSRDNERQQQQNPHQTQKTPQLGIIQSARLMVQNEGPGSLFRGVGSRSLWAACIISGQFFLYDVFRTFFGINSDDLLQVFQLLIPMTAMES